MLWLTACFLETLGPRSGADHAQAAISPRNAGIVATLCGIATFVTAYSYHLYGAFFASATSGANSHIPDLQAMGFRRPQDYVLMLLTMRFWRSGCAAQAIHSRLRL